ncbi:MAG: sugar ABC transporter permease [Chloroflexi bacterium]|nr:sugar ABC transporter permease [Chloroflexota bacterium]MBU1661288.1 sugar ABC transporter permease [Chloroflexota bacterium]
MGTLVLVILPAITTIAISLTKYNSIGVPKFVGLGNFLSSFTSGYVRIGLKNTLIFITLAVPLRVTGALILALFLQEKRRGFGVYRAAVYLPTIMPEVAYAIIWLWIFNPIYGPLNIFLTKLGLPAPEWLINPMLARIAIVIMMSFQLGEGFVIMMAGLQSIPRSFYESARVDGANNWQMFWKITFPLVLPWLLLLTFRDLMMSLQNTFTPSYVLTYGGPYYATTFLPLLIYELAFDFFDFGLAAAVMVFVYLCLVLLVMGILNLVQNRRGEYV